MPNRRSCFVCVTSTLCLAAFVLAYPQTNVKPQAKVDEHLRAVLKKSGDYKSKGDLPGAVKTLEKGLLESRNMLTNRPELQIVLDVAMAGVRGEKVAKRQSTLHDLAKLIQHAYVTQIAKKTLPGPEVKVFMKVYEQAQSAQKAEDYEKAADLYSKLLPRVVRGFGAGHGATATILTELAKCLARTPNHEYFRDGTVERIYRRALEIYSNPSKERATVLAQLAIHLDRDKNLKDDSTIKLYQDSLAILKGLKQPTPDVQIQTAFVCNNLADLHRQRTEFSDAEPLFQRSIAIFNNHKKHPQYKGIIEPLISLGFLKQSVGQYNDAKKNYETALEEAIKLGKEDPKVGQCLATLSLLYSHIGQTQRAELYIECSLNIYRKKFPKEDNLDVVAALNTQAGLFVKQGKLDAALKVLEKCLGIQQRLFATKENLAIALTQNDLANVHRDLANQLRDKQPKLALTHFTKAKELFEDCIRIREKILGTTEPEVGLTRQSLGMFYWDKGDYGKALPELTQALKIREQRFGDRHPDVALNLFNRGLVYAADGQIEKAVTDMDGCRRIVRDYVARELPTRIEAEQFALLHSMDSWSLATCLSLGYSNPDNSQAVKQSAAWLLTGKALVHEGLTLNLQLARTKKDPKIAGLFKRVQDLRYELSLITHSQKKFDVKKRKKVHADLQETETALFDALQQEGAIRLPAESFDYYRNKIPAGAVFIDFVRLQPFHFKNKVTGKARYMAFIYQRNGDIQLEKLVGTADEIDQAIHEFRKEIDSAEDGINAEPAAATARANRKLHVLAKKILHPLLKHIAGVEHWVLSPDGNLWLVPWAALPLADGQTPAIRNHLIGYVNSGRDFARETPTMGKFGPPLIIANPNFDLGLPKKKAPKNQSQHNKTTKVLSGLPDQLPVASVEEIGTVVQPIRDSLEAYSAGQKPILRLRNKALAAELRKVLRPRVLVIGTHGFYLPENAGTNKGALRPKLTSPCVDAVRAMSYQSAVGNNPLIRCGLLFAGVNKLQPDENRDIGVLTGLDIAVTDLHGTELVVLLACETAVGKIRESDSDGNSVASLRQAFQLAGAESVVASLWKVPAKDSAELMKHFFANLANKQTKAEAMRNAQLKLLDSGRKHPWLWAGWTVTGTPVVQPSRFDWTWVILAGALAVLVAVGGAWLYKKRRTQPK